MDDVFIVKISAQYANGEQKHIDATAPRRAFGTFYGAVKFIESVSNINVDAAAKDFLDEYGIAQSFGVWEPSDNPCEDGEVMRFFATIEKFQVYE